MTAPPDLSALVAAVERMAGHLHYLAADDARAAFYPDTHELDVRDAALLSRLAEALKGAQEGERHGRRVLVLPWEER